MPHGSVQVIGSRLSISSSGVTSLRVTSRAYHTAGTAKKSGKAPFRQKRRRINSNCIQPRHGRSPDCASRANPPGRRAVSRLAGSGGMPVVLMVTPASQERPCHPVGTSRTCDGAGSEGGPEITRSLHNKGKVSHRGHAETGFLSDGHSVSELSAVKKSQWGRGEKIFFGIFDFFGAMSRSGRECPKGCGAIENGGPGAGETGCFWGGCHTLTGLWRAVQCAGAQGVRARGEAAN